MWLYQFALAQQYSSPLKAPIRDRQSLLLADDLYPTCAARYSADHRYANYRRQRRGLDAQKASDESAKIAGALAENDQPPR